MCTFKIKNIFRITGKGYILSCYCHDLFLISPSDKAILNIDSEQYILKIKGVSTEKQENHLGLLISFQDFEKVKSFELKEKEIKIVNILERKKYTEEPIKWTGNLSDDCTAKWAGLMLRAEWMDEDYWWWAVYDMQNDEITIDSSNNYEERFIGGDICRKKAEDVAKDYLNIK